MNVNVLSFFFVLLDFSFSFYAMLCYAVLWLNDDKQPRGTKKTTTAFKPSKQVSTCIAYFSAFVLQRGLTLLGVVCWLNSWILSVLCSSYFQSSFCSERGSIKKRKQRRSRQVKKKKKNQLKVFTFKFNWKII